MTTIPRIAYPTFIEVNIAPAEGKVPCTNCTSQAMPQFWHETQDANFDSVRTRLCARCFHRVLQALSGARREHIADAFATHVRDELTAEPRTSAAHATVGSLAGSLLSDGTVLASHITHARTFSEFWNPTAHGGFWMETRAAGHRRLWPCYDTSTPAGTPAYLTVLYRDRQKPGMWGAFIKLDEQRAWVWSRGGFATEQDAARAAFEQYLEPLFAEQRPTGVVL